MSTIIWMGRLWPCTSQLLPMFHVIILVRSWWTYKCTGGFEVVYVSVEDDDCSFNKEFSYMPWLAIPHSDSVSRARLIGRFKVTAFPHLIFINENGRVLTDDGVAVISRYGGDGYPFTPEHLEELKEREQSAKNNQSLQSILVSPYRDFVLSADRRVVSHCFLCSVISFFLASLIYFHVLLCL